MNLKAFLFEDDAVSPVIGVVLMVAITVILAAVIGAAVVGLGSEQSTSTPQASFNYDVNSDGNVTATHDGGDTLSVDRLTVKSDSGTTTNPENASVGSELTAGDSWGAVDNLNEGDTVRIIWENPETGETTVIGKFTR